MKSTLNTIALDQNLPYGPRHSKFDAALSASARWQLEEALKEQILRGYTKQIGSSRFARVTGSVTGSFHLQGEVNGHKIDALPDSSAEKCYIKDDLARSLGLTPEAGSACEILLPSKEKIQSYGSVDVEWKCSGESKVYSLKCFVLPICQHALILGAKVLRQTKTLTDFRNRIKSCIRPLTRRFGLHLLDSERERVWGFLDGCQTSALGGLWLRRNGHLRFLCTETWSSCE